MKSRHPLVVWIPRRRPPRPPDPPRESFWALLWTYATVAVLGLLVLTVVGKPPTRLLPAMAPIASGPAQGGLPALLSRWHLTRIDLRSAHDWLVDGAPLLGWMGGRMTPLGAIHWRSMAGAALAAVTATPLGNLNSLLALSVPELAAVTPEPPMPELPPEAFRTEPGLPGAQGRVWAVLGDHPLVGLYQTHSHESFWPVLPPGTAAAYATDWSKTVVQVGWWLAEDLYRLGVPVVQSRVDNMREGLLASYGLSLQTARTLIRWWPSVRVLLDVQRGNAGLSETVTRIHGQAVARILLVVGTNALLPNPHWHDNLAFATRLARELDRVAPGILRQQGVETVPYRYNQQLLPADIIVEVGGPDNTLGQERRAVFELAAALAELIHRGEVPGLAP